MNIETCETCRFWIEVDGELGECRRYAPPARSFTFDEEDDINPRRVQNRKNDKGQTISDIGVYASWPITFFKHFCGEWRGN